MFRFFRAILDAIIGFLKDETQHPIGKANLATGMVCLIAFGIGCVPSLVEVIVRIALNRPSSAWTALIPLIGLVFLLLFFYFSLRLIPQKTPF